MTPEDYEKQLWKIKRGLQQHVRPIDENLYQAGCDWIAMQIAEMHRDTKTPAGHGECA